MRHSLEILQHVPQQSEPGGTHDSLRKLWLTITPVRHKLGRSLHAVNVITWFLSAELAHL